MAFGSSTIYKRASQPSFFSFSLSLVLSTSSLCCCRCHCRSLFRYFYLCVSLFFPFGLDFSTFLFHCSNEIEVNCYLLKRTVKRQAMSRFRCICNRFNANSKEFYVSHVQIRYKLDVLFSCSLNLIITSPQ